METGLYVSFDDGAHWQSLQSNLPITPIYDFVVKDNDLVIATHGRSFWILDDLTQLHQIQDELLNADNYLLKPRDAVRTPPHLFADFWGATEGKNYHTTLGQNATFYLEEKETGHKVKHVIDGGDDLERGVRITYFLKNKPRANISLTILDDGGNEIETFSSDIPEKKEDRDGLYITADAGMNHFQWPMRYPAGAKMVDTKFHGRPGGPLAQPGSYHAKLTVGDWSMTQSFSLIKDPRVDTTADQLAEQFDFLIKIRDRLSEVVAAVNQIRDLKKQVAGWQKRLTDHARGADVTAAAKALEKKLVAIENELVQSEFTSMGDALNYREMLFEKLSSLPAVVSSADKPPTRQSYEVYDKLSGQIGTQLDALTSVVNRDVAQFNALIASLGVGTVVA